jgi:hypothetical protein
VRDLGYEPIPRLPAAEPGKGSVASPAVSLRFVEVRPSAAQALTLVTQVAWRIHRCVPTATGEVRATCGPGVGVLASSRIEEQPA